MAELLLLGDPTGVRVRLDGESLAIDFDSIAELRSWLRLAGLNVPDLLAGPIREGVDDAGRPYRAMSAFPDWHGWHIYAHATDYTDAAEPLEPHVADQLAALAAAA